jgi:thiamine biosynthesis lipoprotein
MLLVAACGRTPMQEQQALRLRHPRRGLVVSADPERGRIAIAAVLREFDRCTAPTMPGRSPS